LSAPPEPARAVLFDLDGTLVDSAADIAAALNGTLAERGRPPLPVDAVGALTGYGAEELVRRGFAAAGAPLGAEALAAATADYLGRYGAHPAEHTVLFADAGPALADLRERGIRVAVCTNKETALAERVLEAVGVAGDVEAVVGADAVEHRKPDPRHLEATLAAEDATAEEAVYVGDTAIDAEAAAAASLRCAMVAWGAPEAATGPVWARLERFGELAALLAGEGAATTG
jgi:phosphoglycolate phosphatase